MKQFRAVVVEKYLAGVTRGAIFREFQHLGVKRDFVYRTIKRYSETCSTDDRKRSGRKRSVRTAQVVKIIRSRIKRNCQRSARETARSLNKGRESIRKIFRDELKCKPYKKRRVHGISEAAEKKRLERSSALLAWHGGDEIIFSDEKLFVLEQSFNVQNDRLWSVDIKSIPSSQKNVPRFQNASAVMVWAAISRKGKFPLVFIERGVKINANYYLEEILKKNVLPNATQMYGDEYYCFQQDGAPSHTANVVQAWCRQNLTDFLPKEEWPPNSPDLSLGPHKKIPWIFLCGPTCCQNSKTTNIKICSNSRPFC